MLTAVQTQAPQRTATERLLLWLEGLLAFGAYGGAIGFLFGAVDLGPAMSDLPLGSPVLAGFALGVVNGIVPTVVIVGARQGRFWAPLGHHAVGFALMGWIVVQVAFLGWPPHWLQIAYFLYGAVIVALAARATSRSGGRPAR